MDLDGCRDPRTGEIEPRALEVVRDLGSYAEVSPSGTGVKVYLLADPVPRLEANKLVLAKANGHGKDLGDRGLRHGSVLRPHRPAPRRHARRAGRRDRGFRAAGRPDRPGGEEEERRPDRHPPDGRGTPSAATLQLIHDDPTLAALWRGEKRSGDTSASGMDWSLAWELGRRGVPAEEVARVLHAYPYGQLGSGKLKGRQASRRLADLLKRAQEAAEGKGEETDRPSILIVAGKLDQVVEAAAEALGAATRRQSLAGYYRRGNMLVRAVRLAETAGPRRSPVHRGKGALVIAEADVHGLRVALTAAARWQRFDVRRDEWVPADVPKDVALALIATAPDWPAIPVLAGVVEAPTLRPDGTVLDRPGYDPETGLLFDPGGTEFPPVPERPTRAQAEAALAKLREVLAGFPFVDRASESVAISLEATPFVRKACRAVPLHAITAPKMACGKTLLASVAGYVRTGRAPTMMPQAQDPGEERKRLLGVLMDGDEIVVVDNVEREMQSDALCTVLTETAFTDRQLGGNRKVTAPSAATFIVTGNNVAIVGDLSSRTVSCALDPDCERPEEREFDVNLHETVPLRRAELAVATLTIVRAYLVHLEDRGERVRLPNFARFEDWSRLVREPLVWLGMADPCEGRERVEGHDTVRTQLGVLLEAWRENYPGEAATVADALKLATRAAALNEPEADTATRGRLLEAMLAIGGDGRKPSPGAVGKFISKHERRLEGGLRFENAGVSHKVTRWRVTCGGGGFGGFGKANARDLAASTDRNAAKMEERRDTNPPPNPPNPPDNVDRWFRGEPLP